MDSRLHRYRTLVLASDLKTRPTSSTDSGGPIRLARVNRVAPAWAYRSRSGSSICTAVQFLSKASLAEAQCLKFGFRWIKTSTPRLSDLVELLGRLDSHKRP